LVKTASVASRFTTAPRLGCGQSPR
jgi:hypothetical protein